MNDELIPKDIQKFVIEKIDSILQLEAILLFHASPQKGFTEEEVANRLYIAKDETDELLKGLEKNGFIVHSGREYQYWPALPKLAEMTDQLAGTYARALIPLTRLIHDKSDRKIQEFANAFRFWEEE